MRILLADDHRIVREGLRWMLAGEHDIEIVGEATDGSALVEQLETRGSEIDLVLLDISMPGVSGLDALRRLADTGVATPAVVVLSMHQEPAVVRRAIELGAAGYLLKSATREQLLAALRHVARGNCYVQSDVTAPLLAQVAGRATEPRGPTLTEREIEVLELVAAGRGNKQIATHLAITDSTVKTHLKEAFARLGAANRAEAVAKAMQIGLIGDH